MLLDAIALWLLLEPDADAARVKGLEPLLLEPVRHWSVRFGMATEPEAASLNSWHRGGLLAYVETCRCGPPSADVLRFPDADAIADGIAFNRQYREWLAFMLELHPYRGDLRAAASEAEWCYECWESLRDARGDWVSCTWASRIFLARLRELIGEKAYRESAMPPPVPVWRFEVIR